MLDRDTQAAWRRFSTRFSGHGAAFGGVYYILYDYDRRYGSSAHLAPAQVTSDLTWKVQSGLATHEVRPPSGEVDAACTLLPSLDIGSYGKVERVTVREVLGPRAMVGSNLEVVDRQAVDEAYRDLQRRAGPEYRDAVDRMFALRKAAVERQNDAAYRDRFRLVGYETDRVRVNEAWSGPADGALNVAVVGVEPADGAAGETPRRVLAPAESFRFGLDERQFIDLLAQRGLSPSDFVEQVRNARRDRGRDGDVQVARDLMSVPATPLPALIDTVPSDTDPAATQPQ